jgi:IclR family transcriptional regulator, acetate operon repressor
MRNGTPRIASIGKTFATLEAVLAAKGNGGISAIARSLSIPVATAHRQVTTLVDEGFLIRLENGRHIAGPRLVRLLHGIDEKQLVANAAAPVLHRLAARVRAVVQLGTYENDMVTYRIKTGRGSGDLFTRIDMQLEAYCSGIGKILLAHLPDRERELYLASGPFVALTPYTIVDPVALADELKYVRKRGYALDQGEIAEDLHCIAAPIRKPDGTVIAAISISQNRTAPKFVPLPDLLPPLTAAQREIEQAAFTGQL